MNEAENKCVFLDRDGVINQELGDYAYRLDHFKIIPGVKEALQQLKSAGFLLIVITNQAGIAKNRYTAKEVMACHYHLQKTCGFLVDDLYFSPHHPTVTESLLRKPDSLMFEKAMAKHKINAGLSWMVGDSARDIYPAQKMKLSTIGIGKAAQANPDYVAQNLLEAVNIILKRKN